MFNSVRIRLTLWYTAILGLILIAFALTVYFLTARTVRQNTDNTLAELTATFEKDVKEEIGNEAERNRRLTQEQPKNRIENALQEAADEFQSKEYRILIFDQAKQPVFPLQWGAGNAAAPLNDDLPQIFAALDKSKEEQTFQTLRGEIANWRILARRLQLGTISYTIIVIRSLAAEDALLDNLRLILLVIVPVAVLLASASGYFLARKSLMPVLEMSRRAAQIRADNLHERLPIANERDELGLLAATFNGLLSRLDESFAQQRRFMADASHELRTPLAIVRGESEIALSKPERLAADYQESLEIVHDEARRMSRIVEDLMTLARVDAGQVPLHKIDLELGELLADCVRAVRVLAEEKQIRLLNRIENEMPFRGDTGLLRRLFLNLLDNAIKYNKQSGSVEIGATRETEFYVVRISDTGSGIPLAARPHIFERFFRADSARSRAETASGSGAGLGLSIARWIAEAHDGKLELETSDEKGTTFAVKLPVKTPTKQVSL